MTLYDKIIELGKRNGWSQEELGAKIGVSRQAVSKWEMAQTTPDLGKIMAMSELFGVSTDFLLKEEYDLSSLDKRIESPVTSEVIGNPQEKQSGATEEKKHFVSLDEINSCLTALQGAARNYVIAVFLFFMSPFAGLFILLFDENKAIIGIVIQVIVLVIVAIIIVLTLSKLSKFKYLKNEENELDYGVRGMIMKKREDFNNMHLVGIMIGIVCMIGCVIPMMVVSAFTSYNDTAIVVCGCLMLIIFAVGVSCILYVQCINYGIKKY